MTSMYRRYGYLSIVLLLGLSFGLYGCSDDSSPKVHFEEPDTACNPVGLSTDCFYPFPSDAFRVETDDGHAIEFQDSTLASLSGSPMQFDIKHPLDGYPTVPPILADLGEPIDADSLIFQTGDLSESTQSDAPVVILNAETGEPIAHWSELDASEKEANRRILQIRLLKALDPDTRYIVAIQGVKNQAGEPIAPLESFENIAFTKHYPYFEDAQAHMRDDILPALTEFGVDVDQVQLAWDFTTRTDASARGDLLSIIAQTQSWLDDQAGGPTITVKSVTDYDTLGADPEGNKGVGRDYLKYWIHATVEIPLFLDSADPGARLQYDDQGAPEIQSTYALPLDILIPRSVVADGETDGAIQFGHGFFGTTAEMRTSFLPKFLDDSHFVAAGINWWGLANADQAEVLTDLTKDPTHLFDFTDRLKQSFANQSVVARAVKTSLKDFEMTEEPKLDVGAYFDTDHQAFYGISLGHILGSTAIALSKDIQYGVLSVGGGPFSFIMSRSGAFAPLWLFIGPAVSNDLGAQKFIAMASLAMESIDPITYAGLLLHHSFDGTVLDRKILAQVGIGDPSVPTLSAMIWARSAGMPVVEPTAEAFTDTFDVKTTTLPSDGSAFELFDFDLDGVLPGTHSKFPDHDNGVHQGVRADPNGQIQVRSFINRNGIPDACDGICHAQAD